MAADTSLNQPRAALEWRPPALAGRPRPPRQLALEHTGQRLFRAAEVLIAVVGLFFFAGALSDVLRSGGATTQDGENLVLRTLYSALYLLALPAMLLRWKRMAAAVLRHPWVLLLVALALLSSGWAVDGDWALRRSVAFAATTAFGIYLAARFDTRSLLLLLAAALGAAALLSLLFAVALPAYGVETGKHAGAWRGVFSQKNNFGQIMVLSTVVFALTRSLLRRHRWLATAGMLLSAALVLASTSKTALVVLLTLAALSLLYRPLRWRSTLAVPVLTASVLTAGATGVLLVANADYLLDLMGRDASLTGRTPIWEAVLASIAQRPWLGYGYSAFWPDFPNSPSAWITGVLEWDTPNAHNGFLDLALQLGGVGLAIFLASFVIAGGRALARVRQDPSAGALWPVLFLSYTLLYNLTESSLVIQHHLLWVLYPATVCSVLLAAGRRRPAESPADGTRGAAP